MKIYLSEKNKKIAGVCGGIAEAYNIDPTAVRLGVLVLAVLTGGFPAIIGYIIAAMIIPTRAQANASKKESVREDNEG